MDESFQKLVDEAQRKRIKRVDSDPKRESEKSLTVIDVLLTLRQTEENYSDLLIKGIIHVSYHVLFQKDKNSNPVLLIEEW